MHLALAALPEPVPSRLRRNRLPKRRIAARHRRRSRELVAAAHDGRDAGRARFRREPRLVGHPAFQAALHGPRQRARRAGSPSPTGRASTCSFFGVADHPQLDYRRPGRARHMIDSARHWLELGVDGFRCDSRRARRTPSGAGFRAATRRAGQDSITIGEIVETPALQRTYRGRMDGCLDFLPPAGAAQRSSPSATLTATEFDAFLAPAPRVLRGRLRHALVPRQPRHEPVPVGRPRGRPAVCGWRRSASSRCPRRSSITAPRSACRQRRDVRYADGSGHPEESRLPMPWGPEQDGALLDFFRRLVAFRAADPRLWRGERTTIAPRRCQRPVCLPLRERAGRGGRGAQRRWTIAAGVQPGGMPGWSVAFATDAGAVAGRATRRHTGSFGGDLHASRHWATRRSR